MATTTAGSGDASQAPPSQGETVTDGQHPDIEGLSYEQARDELVSIVARLEAGQVPLEESMSLWHRGEALAAHCTTWLDGAQAQLQRAGGAADDAADPKEPAAPGPVHQD